VFHAWKTASCFCQTPALVQPYPVCIRVVRTAQLCRGCVLPFQVPFFGVASAHLFMMQGADLVASPEPSRGPRSTFTPPGWSTLPSCILADSIDGPSVRVGCGGRGRRGCTYRRNHRPSILSPELWVRSVANPFFSEWMLSGTVAFLATPLSRGRNRYSSAGYLGCPPLFLH